MQRGESARELLRASATDAVAARQLLAAMDADEVRFVGVWQRLGAAPGRLRR